MNDRRESGLDRVIREGSPEGEVLFEHKPELKERVRQETVQTRKKQFCVQAAVNLKVGCSPGQGGSQCDWSFSEREGGGRQGSGSQSLRACRSRYRGRFHSV